MNNETIKKITRIVILVGVVLWIGWDLYAVIAGNDATISIQLTSWAHKLPILPFGVGVVIGHWFWPA